MNLTSPLLILRDNAEKSAAALKQKLSTVHGQIPSPFDPANPALQELIQHLRATRILECSVRLIREDSSEGEIPDEVQETLASSKALASEVASRFFGSHNPDSVFDLEHCCVDQHRLFCLDPLKEAAKVPDTHFEWYLNFSLLMNVYRWVNSDEDMKKRIGFLVLQYLGKGAPYCFEELSLPLDIQKKLTGMFQHALIEPGIVYNRESSIFDPFLRPAILEQLAEESGHDIFVIGSSKIEDFLPLWFSMLTANPDKTCAATWKEELIQYIRPHLSRLMEHHFDDYMDPPLCIDFTELLGRSIYRSIQEQEEQTFETKWASLRKELDQALQETVDLLVQEHQDPLDPSDVKKRLLVYLRSNLMGICHGEWKEAGFIQLLPLFGQEDLELPPESRVLSKYTTGSSHCPRALREMNFIRAKMRFTDFINGTGIRLGSVEGRKVLFNHLSLEQVLESKSCSKAFFSGLGPNTQFFSLPSDLTNSVLFKRFSSMVADDALRERNLPLFILGKSTVDLVRGFFAEIEELEWNRMNERPELREIIQNSLYRILMHLAKADHHKSDFGKWTQALELVQYEILTLLEIFAPFDPNEFSQIYLDQLSPFIPEKLRPLIKPGLTKSSMNTFSGIHTAVCPMNKKAIAVCQPGVHFEMARFMGRPPPAPHRGDSDLYVCEFNHNINLDDPKQRIYRAGDIESEIKKLLDPNSSTQRLTVAIDCTIDLECSTKIQKLLSDYSELIEKGVLNFIMFRSGQKFDMLGFDHCYGSPFYMVNNGDPCWKPFERLMNHPVHRTDSLSIQWFCLMKKYAPEAVDLYREAIFKQTRSILSQVPEVLQPGTSSPIQVCSVEPGMDACFIDIKISGKRAGHYADDLKQRLYRRFAEEGGKVHTRGGYGYFHPNICMFTSEQHGGTTETIRINPGINEKETGMIVEFLNEAAALVQ